MKKLLKIFLIFSISLVNSSFADTVYLEKDKPAPFSGFLFDEAKGREIKQRLVEATYFEQLNISLEKQVKLYENIETRNNEKYGILLEQNDRLAKSLSAERTVSTWEKIAYFALGAGAVIFGGWAIGQIK